jgi:hypothetical protein
VRKTRLSTKLSSNGCQNIITLSKIIAWVSFRDKVLGAQTIPVREKVDLIGNKMAKVELVQGNRLMPMLHVEPTIMNDLSVPWKDAFVVKILGKNIGYNSMKTKLENVWKLVGGIELMDIGHAY